MKIKLLLSLLLIFPVYISAKQITNDVARNVALNFIEAETKNNLRSNSGETKLELAYTAQKNKLRSTSSESENYYYIFNKGNNNGYIIIAADDSYFPVIGYTTSGSYTENDQSPSFKAWIKAMEGSIQKTIWAKEQIPNNIQSSWNKLLSGNSLRSTSAVNSVDPLIKTQWGQTYPFNDVNPHRVFNYPPTGCVATAMGQIMKYYEHPLSGTRPTESYTSYSNKYNEPSVDITQYQYDWANMKDTYIGYDIDTKESTVAVSTLLLHCGLAVKMDYDDASGAMSINAALAFSKYFDYEPVKYTLAENHTKEEFENILKDELDNNRPVFLAGNNYEERSAHAYVCDGYDENGLFHINFGWKGSQDGFYYLDNSEHYPDDQQIVYGIKPKNENSPSNDWAIVSEIESRVTTIERGFKFDVKAQYTDKQSFSRILDYDLVLCDDQNQIVTRINVEDSFFNNQIKSCAVSYTFTGEGTYKIRAVYGGTDTFVEVIDGYTEKYITLLNSEEGINVVLTSDMQVAPNSPTIQNGVVVFTTYYKNIGTIDFNGYIGIVLVDYEYDNENGDRYYIRYSIYEKPATIAAGAEAVELRYTWIVKDKKYCGNYDAMVVIKEKEEDEWTFLDDATNINPWGYFKLTNNTGDRLFGLTPQNLIISDKVYDGTTTATVSDWGSLSGNFTSGTDVKLDQSTFKIQFETPNVEENSKPIKLLQGINLIGEDAYNYYIKYDNLYSLTAKITEAPLTVTANDIEILEGTDPASLNLSGAYTIDGFVPGENENVMSSYPIVSINSSITSSTSVGNYENAIEVTSASAPNYNVTHKYGKLTIKPYTVVGIEDEEAGKSGINIYPNPVERGKSLTVDISNSNGGIIYLYTVTGVCTGITKVQNNRTSLSIPDIAGVYTLYYVNKAGRTFRKQLIVK